MSDIGARGHFACTTLAGEMVILTPYNLSMEPPLVTPVRLWLYGENWNNGRWDDDTKSTCPWCGQRFTVSDEILDVIGGINRDAKLSPAQSPCLELPAEAWEEPRLLSECPHCHKLLKFNPFIVDNRGRY